MEELMAALQNALFPEYYSPAEAALGLLQRLVGEEMAQKYWATLPQLRAELREDLQAAWQRDPAAQSLEEVAVCYPGFYAVTAYRLAHGLQALGVSVLPRRLTEWAHRVTGIDIHPGAVIGPGFFIDHGTGVVIGETTRIGRNVTLYQGVTLGALSTRGGQALRGIKRHPTLEDAVTVYANATILGGNTVIGRCCMIGADAFVTASVPPDTVVFVEHPELIIR